MADVLISPSVGIAMTAVFTDVLFYSAYRARMDFDPKKIPLTGVLGAFVFAAQMLNFSIPATGSSGHVTGAVFLAAMLGPWRAFIAMACVLAIQAFVFADGGILAYGCNLFNMGFWSCLLAYPLLFKPLAGRTFSNGRIWIASLLACAAGAELGAASVVAETLASGAVNIPPMPFLALMMPIHLAIGLIEGAATAALLVFLRNARPALFAENEAETKKSSSGAFCALLFAGALILATLSVFASESPDGLEWSLARTETVAEDAPRPALEYDIFGGMGGACATFALLACGAAFIAGRKIKA